MERIDEYAQRAVDDEASLIALINAGNNERFYELIQPYEIRMYRVAIGLVRNEEDAEEVVQEAFLNAFRALKSFRFASRFSTWLTSITINEARGRLRRRRAVLFESIDAGSAQPDDMRLEFACTRPLQLDLVQRAEIRRFWFNAIARLQSSYREIYYLREIKELSTTQAAVALGLTNAQAKMRLHRARRLLQVHLAAAILTPRSSNVDRLVPPASEAESLV